MNNIHWFEWCSVTDIKHDEGDNKFIFSFYRIQCCIFYLGITFSSLNKALSNKSIHINVFNIPEKTIYLVFLLPLMVSFVKITGHQLRSFFSEHANVYHIILFINIRVSITRKIPIIATEGSSFFYSLFIIFEYFMFG